jgi:hypothetical protein
MGYNTWIEVKAIDASTGEEMDRMKISEKIIYKKDSFFGIVIATGGEEMRWYNCIGDMKKLSKKNKGILFIVNGMGDAQGDIWRSFFLDGASWDWTLEYEIPTPDAYEDLSNLLELYRHV